MRAVALLLAMSVGLACAAEGNKMDALQGTWRRERIVREGKPVPKEKAQAEKLTAKGDRYTLRIGDDKRSGTLKLDPSKSPKTIDIDSGEGPNKGKTLKGIYELHGDTFIYCVAPPDKSRPTTLESKPGSGLTLLVSKRLQP